MYAFGVGALVDLPNFSVIVGGLDDWDTTNVEEVFEDRLLEAVREFHPRAERLLSAPWLEETNSPFDKWARVGVPVLPFPRWMRCSACNVLASIDSGVFQLRRGYFPEQARYVHDPCPRTPRRSATAVPARFVVACQAGHVDDFPWKEFVHRNTDFKCAKERSRYVIRDMGTGSRSTDVYVHCEECGEGVSMRQAFGEGAEHVLPRCRGRHAHLRRFDEECKYQMRAMLLGASNSWFPVTRAALSIPVSSEPLEQLVAELWPVIQGSRVEIDSLEKLAVAIEFSPELGRLASFDVQDVWGVISTRREGSPTPSDEPPDLLSPEWAVFTDPYGAPQSRDFRLGMPTKVPGLDGVAEVVPVERLRQVVALCAFTRVDGPDSGVAEDLLHVECAPLARSEVNWVPAAEVRGEGIFIRLPEETVSAWEEEVADKDAIEALRTAVQEWRRQRGLDPAVGWLGPRYVLLHTLAHALSHELALECGYAAASIRERVYAGEAPAPMAGVLLYTAAPDAEGTLGGLVALAEPDTFARLLDQTLRRAALCSTDPMCAGHSPEKGEVVLHGAACHACLFVPETGCERGNRLLDRAVLTETLTARGVAYPFR